MRTKALLAIAALLWSSLSIADDYPSRPITFIVPTPAGGSVDSLARTLAEEMRKRMGQAIIVENKPGAAGMLAAQTVARAKPDGYTVLVTHSTPIANAPFLYSKMAYDVRRDFAFVTQLWEAEFVLAVNKDVPANNVKEFLAWAAKNKGKVSYGSYGIGSFGHLVGAYLSQSKGLDMTHIAYKGVAPMVQDLIGGQISWCVVAPSSLASYFPSGRARALAAFGDHRFMDLPNVPTMAEAGLAEPEYKPVSWAGMMVPAGTPGPVLARLEKEARAAIQTPTMKSRLQVFTMAPIGNSPAEFRRNVETTLPVIERMVKISGAKAE